MLTKEPANTGALLAKAEVAVRQNQLDSAFETLQTALKNNPNSAPAHYSLGRLYALRRESKEAADAFGEALRINPRMAAADIELARLAIADRRLDDAEKFATEALHVRPNYPDAQLLLAQTYLLQRNAAKAEPIILALAKAQPDSPVVKADLGELELLKKNQAGARKAFDAAIQQNPTQLSAMARLVSMDLQEHRTAAARERLDAAVRAAPRNAPLLVMAARFYLEDGRTWTPPSARGSRPSKPTPPAWRRIRCWEACTSPVTVSMTPLSSSRTPPRCRDARSGPTRRLACSSRCSAGRRKPRCATSRRSSLDPHAAVAANNLAWIYMDQGGSLDEALKLAKTAKEGLPNRPEVADTLAWAFYRLGQFSQAVTPLLDAIAKDPSNPTYHYHLGMVYVSLSQPVKARPELEKSVALRGTGAEADAARQALAKLR